MNKLPEMPCPPGWNEDEWAFKARRLEICYNCEHHFLDETHPDPMHRTGWRINCAECGCSSYQMSHDLNAQRCPLGKWILWSDWEKIKASEQ